MMCFNRALIVTLVLLMAGTFASAADLVLVQDGKPTAVIVTPDAKDPNASGAVRAAGYLADHIAKMSGAKLPVYGASQLGNVTATNGNVSADKAKFGADAKLFIFVGDSALAKQAGYSSDGLTEGGILVKTGGNSLALIGSSAPGDPYTSTYAVIECLQRLGCRYLWPGESGKVIPQRSTITLGSIDYHYAPQIVQRGIRFMGMSERPLSGLLRLGLDKAEYDAANKKATESSTPITWPMWQRLGGSAGIAGGAAGGGLRGGWDQWGASHPEWFALQMDGTRDQSKSGGRFRLCVSNEGLIEHVANDIIDRANKDPKLTSVSLCPNDGGLTSFCLCDRCKALDPPDAPKVKMLIFPVSGKSEHKEVEVPALTDRFVHYWNAIAERVEKVHPNMLFLCEAYSYYSLPPVREKLNPNIIIRYVPSTTDGWEGWKNAGTKRIYWRPNILLAGRHDDMDHVMLDQLTQRMSYMADGGMYMTDFDSISDNWSTQGLNYYAAAQLDWNPHLTSEQILDDYCQNGFGPAAGPIKQFFQLVQQITLKEERHFTPERISQLRGYLADATTAAKDDPAVEARIDFLRIGLNHTDLFATLAALNEQAKGKSGAELKSIRAKAQPLLDLNYLELRDIVKNHNLAINSSYLMFMTNDFAIWEAIGGRGYRPSDAVVALGNDHSLTGKENSLSAMEASFGLDKLDAAARQPKTATATDMSSKTDADENGKVTGK
jgi:hypothetical protein